MAERSNASVCKTDAERLRGFESLPLQIYFYPLKMTDTLPLDETDNEGSADDDVKSPSLANPMEANYPNDSITTHAGDPVDNNPNAPGAL